MSSSTKGSGSGSSKSTTTASKDNHSQHDASKASSQKGNPHMGGRDTKAMSQASDVSKRFQEGKMPYGKSYKGKDGQSCKYDRCPSHLQRCCKPSNYHGWSQYCWYPRFGCCGYWCLESKNWYYWCEQHCCYLPATYMEEYPSVEPAECSEPVAPVEPERQVTVDSAPCVGRTASYTTTPCATPCYTTSGAPCHKSSCEVSGRKSWENPVKKPSWLPSSHETSGNHRPGYTPSNSKKTADSWGQTQRHDNPSEHNGGQKGQKSGK